MPIPMVCSGCGHEFRVEDDLSGKQVECEQCGKTLQVFFPSATDPGQEVSESGYPIYRHKPRKQEFQIAVGESETIDAVSHHIEEHIGKVESVYHELISDLVHVDIHMVPPTDKKPWYTLVTSGMSDQAMAVPEGAEGIRFAELVICLPPDWPMTQEDFKDERNYWPIRSLKMLSRLPHEYETFLGYQHTVPNGDPAEPFARNTKLCCNLLLWPQLPGQDFAQLKVNEEKTIWFYSVVPIYREEMNFKLKEGSESLEDRLLDNKITELLDVRRVNVCKKKWWF